ncbi:MAG: hypothetical protein AB1505_32625 [Candidatus Latescibacterota bacterium]
MYADRPSLLRLRPAVLLLALALGAALFGCGADTSPLASAPGAPQAVPADQAYLVFSPAAAHGLAKTAVIPREGASVSRWIGRDGGVIRLADRGGFGSADDLVVSLRVPEGALPRRTEIRMTVYGNRLSELVVAFAPGGLVFAPYALLVLSLGGEWVDTPLEGLQAYHVDSEGHAEPATVLDCRSVDGWGDEGGDWVRASIRIAVPGFSRYGIGNTY